MFTSGGGGDNIGEGNIVWKDNGYKRGKKHIKYKRSIRAENRILTDDGVCNIGDDISIIGIETDYRI